MKLQSSLQIVAGVCCVGRLPCGPKLCRSLCLLLRREGTMTSAHLQQVSFSSGFPLASIFTRDPCLQTSHPNRLSPPLPRGTAMGPSSTSSALPSLAHKQAGWLMCDRWFYSTDFAKKRLIPDWGEAQDCH